ncbi:MAG: molybdopterin-dependent oxidoreductase [Deltaproteobacteria bacterium]|jgi:formate dehydrogenase alpha subunit|nr:molybdopterin-dependent oxidoreductase [Deltaproteobacteria bacterium]
MITVKIDGNDVQVAPDATILDAAEKLGIKIPTLCYLKKVSPTGACRICAVEVDGADKNMTACNTRVVNGMNVITQSEKLTAIRRQIVELLLVNHPLDCPVCDAGGECDLQDVCYSLDVTSQPFEAEDVNAETIDRWPLIQQVPNRCVMCEKCVKVCHELIGSSALFINEKGDKAFIDKTLEKCEFCGNCVQVCPTGTMISKPFKFKARPWELRKTASVCALCPAQCQVDMHSKQGKLLRVTAEDDTTVNEGNLCIGGFFGHDYLNSEKRLTTPLVNQQPVSWDEALDTVVKELTIRRDEGGGSSLAGLASPRLSNEENYLFQKLFRVALNSNNIDSEMRFGLLRAMKVLHALLNLTGGSNPINRLGQADSILVFGSDLTAEAPALDWQIQVAHRKRDAKLIVANPRATKLAGQSETCLPYRPGSETQLACGLAKLIVDKNLADVDFLRRYVPNYEELFAYLDGLDLDAICSDTGVDRLMLQEAAGHLGQANSVAIVFGRDLTGAAEAEQAVAALANLAMICGALHGDQGGLYPVDDKGNAFGLLDAGVAPELLPGWQDYAAAKPVFEKTWHVALPEQGADASEILSGIERGVIRTLYLVGTNPLVSYPENARWRSALKTLDFLVVQDIVSNDLTAMANVVLPGAATAEKRGTLTTLDGRVNILRRAVDPPGQARPDLAILADLFAGLTGKPAPSETALQQELMQLSALHTDACLSLNTRQFCWKHAYAPDERSLVASLPPIKPLEPAEMLLLVGKHRFQFGTTTTYGDATNTLVEHGSFLMNPADAEAYQVASHPARIKVTGPARTTTGQVEVTDQVPKGLIFAPSNFSDLNAQQVVTSRSNCVPVTVEKA